MTEAVRQRNLHSNWRVILLPDGTASDMDCQSLGVSLSQSYHHGSHERLRQLVVVLPSWFAHNYTVRTRPEAGTWRHLAGEFVGRELRRKQDETSCLVCQQLWWPERTGKLRRRTEQVFTVKSFRCSEVLYLTEMVAKFSRRKTEYHSSWS